MNEMIIFIDQVALYLPGKVTAEIARPIRIVVVSNSSMPPSISEAPPPMIAEAEEYRDRDIDNGSEAEKCFWFYSIYAAMMMVNFSTYLVLNSISVVTKTFHELFQNPTNLSIKRFFDQLD